MKVLALDLSKRSTGWACWNGESERPIYGHWRLGSEFTTDGAVFAKLHSEMNALFRVQRYDVIYFEEPIHPAQLSGHTNAKTIRLAAGLAAHVESFAYAVCCRRVEAINVQTWRKDFIGRQSIPKGGKRGDARNLLKELTIERCRQLGFTPQRDDEADAIGILDYALGLNGIVPPWRKDEVLRPMLTGAK